MAALVWSPAPDPHAKSSALAAPARPPSPASSSGIVHWMSMMAADHPHMNPPHGHDVHYMWNGVETKMNPTDQHNAPSMQKGTNGSSHVNKYQAGRYKKRQPFPAGGGHDGPWSSKDFLDDRRASCADRRTAESPESGAALATDFVHWPQPAFRGPGSGLEDPRPGSMESPQMHSMYGNHGNHGNRSNSSSSNSPPVSVATTSASMLVVPQPINAIAKPTLNAAAAAAANGSGRKYQCKMCPQIFLHKSAMQHHAREVHRGELKPHQCQQCLKSFSSNHQLVQHIRIHTGEKPYKCSYCERRFKQLSHVQQHTRLHTGERPYKCHLPECGRAFIQLSNLQQHLRNHDNQVERSKNRPFHCSICGKGFASESSLRTHTSKQHAALIGGQNSQSCPVCHKMFLGSEALMDHMRTAHKDPNATGVASKKSAKRGSAHHPRGPPQLQPPPPHPPLALPPPPPPPPPSTGPSFLNL